MGDHQYGLHEEDVVKMTAGSVEALAVIAREREVLALRSRLTSEKTRLTNLGLYCETQREVIAKLKADNERVDGECAILRINISAVTESNRRLERALSEQKPRDRVLEGALITVPACVAFCRCGSAVTVRFGSWTVSGGLCDVGMIVECVSERHCDDPLAREEFHAVAKWVGIGCES
jgi:predicted RNase H-like nuclease (RuvC/YqgF family)